MIGGHPIVSLADPLLDPLVEFVTDNRVDHVGEPSPRDLWQVALLREVLAELGVIASDVEEVLGGQPVVMGQIDYSTGNLLNN